jgi:hypothetical protein
MGNRCGVENGMELRRGNRDSMDAARPGAWPKARATTRSSRRPVAGGLRRRRDPAAAPAETYSITYPVLEGDRGAALGRRDPCPSTHTRI